MTAKIHEHLTHTIKQNTQAMMVWVEAFSKDPTQALRDADRITRSAFMVETAKFLEAGVKTLESRGESDVLGKCREELARCYADACARVEAEASPYNVQRMAAVRETMRDFQFLG